MKTRMKKWVSCLLAAVMTLTVTFSLLPQRAEAAGASLSGSSSLRAGSSVTLTFSVSGSGIVALQGSLNYDSDKLEFIGMDQLIGGAWGVELSGSTIMADDAKLSTPIDGSADILAVTFRVKSGVDSGATVSAGISGISASDGSRDFSLGNAYWEASIAAPLSSNAKLSSLSCSDAALYPEFSSGTTYYTVTVPYDVTALSLNYDTADSGADAYVSGNELDVGSNTVTVAVEAEDGTTKYYTIEATREQDPNYEASTDATLSKLKVSSGRLSPAFSPDVTDYVVYVPFEKENFSVDGSAHDSKALDVQGQKTKLVDGDNTLTVVCTAEDGTTTKTYTVHVYRMPAYNGVLPTITDPNAQVIPDPEPTPAPTLAIPATLTLPVIGVVSTYVAAGAALVVLLLLSWLIGLLIGRAAGKKKALKGINTPEEAPAAKEDPPAVKEEIPAEEAPASAPEEPVAVEVPAEEAAEEKAEEPTEEPLPAPQEISIDDILNDIRNM